MILFKAEQLTAGYGDAPVVQQVSFALEAGCVLGILGANGSGKTTLLKSICGILPHSGRCILDGTALEELNARQAARLCGYIPQRSGITLSMPVLDVVLMGFNPRLGLLQQPTAAMQAAAMQALEQVGLAHRAQEDYLTLSEGQKQLCILARTLAADTKLMLLDEPESALDFGHRHRLMELVRSRVTGQRRAAVVTLHDPQLALNGCDALLLLDGGRCLGLVRPGSDAPARIEPLLSQLYGPVSLTECRSRSGRRQLVMLREEEAP